MVHIVFCQVPSRIDLCTRFQTLDINTPQNPTCCCLSKSTTSSSTVVVLVQAWQATQDSQKTGRNSSELGVKTKQINMLPKRFANISNVNKAWGKRASLADLQVNKHEKKQQLKHYWMKCHICWVKLLCMITTSMTWVWVWTWSLCYNNITYVYTLSVVSVSMVYCDPFTFKLCNTYIMHVNL